MITNEKEPSLQTSKEKEAVPGCDSAGGALAFPVLHSTAQSAGSAHCNPSPGEEAGGRQPKAIVILSYMGPRGQPRVCGTLSEKKAAVNRFMQYI